MIHSAYQFCRSHVSRRLIFFVILFSVVLFFLAVDFEKDYSMRRPFMGLLYRSQIGAVNTPELTGKTKDSESNRGDTAEEFGKDVYRVDSNRTKGQSSENETVGNGNPPIVSAEEEDGGSKFEHRHKVTTVMPQPDRRPSKEFTLELVAAKENYTIPSAEGSKEIGPAAAGSQRNETSTMKVKKGYLVYSEACQIPDVDPYHPTVRKLIATSPPLSCAKDYMPLTYAVGNTLKINESLVDYWKKRENMTSANGTLVCCFQEIFRADDGRSDNAVGISKNCTVFESGEEMKIEFALVRCKVEGVPRVLFKNYHSFVMDKAKTEERCRAIENNRTADEANFDKYNVVIIGADAMSRINMHRQLKKTFKYLTDSMGGIEMKGFNKVGDNTFPNLIPLLMGVDTRELPQVCRNCSDPMDACTLVWDGFSNEGYRTFYAEDTPHISTFNYLKPGFLAQPTDYYYRTMIHPLEDDLGRDKRLNCHLCVGAMAEAEAVLDYAQRFISNFGNRKYFAMSWINSMSHDFLNSASAGDHFFANFFRSLHNNSHLDNTFVILMGDHGLRWGEIRETHIGRLEERLPMLIIVPPKNFKVKYPELHRNLRDNANRLVTPFDLYATIQNVLRFRGISATVVPESVADEPHLKEIRAAVVKRSKSLFGPIPVNRSCKDAAIDEAWCTCHTSEPVNTTDPEVIHVSEFLVEKLNALFAGHPECSKLNLNRVLKANLRTPKNKLHAERRPTSNILDYTVEIETVPGQAKFEATVRFVPYKHEHVLLGDVSRLNLYGDQSSCVTDAILRKYCYCVPKR